MRAKDVRRHHVRGPLHAAKVEPEEARQRLHGQRLGDAGHAFDQRMSAAQQRDQRLIDQFPLASEHAAQLRAALAEDALHRAQRLGHCGIVFYKALAHPMSPDFLLPVMVALRSTMC